MSKLVSCDLQDHFEHAVVLRLPVRLTLVGGDLVSGQAVDLTRRDGIEFIHVQVGGETRTVALNEIGQLRYPHPQGDEALDGQRWRVIAL